MAGRRSIKGPSYAAVVERVARGRRIALHYGRQAAPLRSVERAKGFEPATACLESTHPPPQQHVQGAAENTAPINYMRTSFRILRFLTISPM